MSQTQHTAHAQRTHLPVDKILHLLDEGHRQADVAEIFGTTQSTISRIFKNCQPAPATLCNAPGVRICSCCKRHLVAEGHHFLCSWCFRYADAGDPTFSEHTVAI